ncbi:MAG: GDSL-type esterase/lipase family protein [Litorimonas sp.]
MAGRLTRAGRWPARILVGSTLLVGCASAGPRQAASDCVPQAALDAYVQNSIERKADVYASLSPEPGQTIFLGSSLIEEGPWRELFGDDVLNRGISAETTHDLLARVEAVAADRPARLFLYTGGNNLSRGGETPEQAAAGVAQVVSALSEALPETIIHLSTLLPREARHADKVAAVNAALVRLAETRTLPLIDAHAAFSDPDGALRADFTNDGIHLNGEGYRLWATIIEQGLEETR